MSSINSLTTTTMNNFPVEMIIQIMSYMYPLYIHKYIEPDIEYLNDCYNHDDIKKQCLDIIKLSSVCKYFNNIVRECGMKVIYFTGNINIKAINRYKSRYLIAPYDAQLNDNQLKLLTDLIYLDNVCNRKITDKGIKPLINLIFLKLGWCANITNKGIKPLINLTELNLYNNMNVTRDGLKPLTKLKKYDIDFENTWVRRLGSALLTEVSIEIGGKTVQTHCICQKCYEPFCYDETDSWLGNIFGGIKTRKGNMKLCSECDKYEYNYENIGYNSLIGDISQLVCDKYENNNAINNVTDDASCFVPQIYNNPINKLIKPIISITFSSIEDKNITDKEIIPLTNITYLHLCFNENVTNKGIQPLTNMNSLILYRNENVTDMGIELLTNMTVLVLGCSRNITNKGIRLLTNLTHLYLWDGNNITDKGIRQLTNLIELYIRFNKNITDKGIKPLTNLIYLGLPDNENITYDKIKSFTKLKLCNTKNVYIRRS